MGYEVWSTGYGAASNLIGSQHGDSINQPIKPIRLKGWAGYSCAGQLKMNRSSFRLIFEKHLTFLCSSTFYFILLLQASIIQIIKPYAATLGLRKPFTNACLPF